MEDIINKKRQALINIVESYENYNGKPNKQDYESIKKYFIYCIANSRKIFIKFEELTEKEINEKFKPLEDIEQWKIIYYSLRKSTL